MLEELKNIEKEVEKLLYECKTLEDLNQLRTDYLGKTGKMTEISKSIGKLPKEDRPEFGKKINEVKDRLSVKIESVLSTFENEANRQKLEKEKIDVTLPGKQSTYGYRHPLTQTLDDIRTIFHRLGYTVADGPEIESDYYNFEKLNFPADHPARDLHDTFFVEDGFLLRTHTSPVQIRVMENQKPPVRVLMPGRVYRNDEADASHSPVFRQVEGLVVDEGISFADLKGTLEYFIHCFFGKEKKVRFRPSFFPFT
ncbi:MAG: phenylalanine--tRNA ligase subunit alpha, partial [Candidatus Margulisiibacteriota bacterium]